MQMASWYYFDNGRWQQGFCALTFHKLGIVLKLTSAHTLIGRREYLPSFACKIVRSAKKRVLIRKKREKSGHAEEQGGGGLAIWATPQRIGFTWSPPVIYTVLVQVRPQPNPLGLSRASGLESLTLHSTSTVYLNEYAHYQSYVQRGSAPSETLIVLPPSPWTCSCTTRCGAGRRTLWRSPSEGWKKAEAAPEEEDCLVALRLPQ